MERRAAARESSGSRRDGQAAGHGKGAGREPRKSGTSDAAGAATLRRASASKGRQTVFGQAIAKGDAGFGAAARNWSGAKGEVTRESSEKTFEEVAAAGGMDRGGVGIAWDGGAISPWARAEDKRKRVRAADEGRAAGGVRDGGSVAIGSRVAEMRRGVEQGFAGGAIRGCVDRAGARVGGYGDFGGKSGCREASTGDGFGKAADCADGAGGSEDRGVAEAGRDDTCSGFGLGGRFFAGWRSAGLSFNTPKRFADFKG